MRRRNRPLPQHAPALAGHGLTADHRIEGYEHIASPDRAVGKRRTRRKVAAADVDTGIVCRKQRDSDANGLALGFGQSDMPSHKEFRYSFDALADRIARFTEVIGVMRFALYVFDYGAPTGFRLAMRHPERITVIISQNGNAYEEGLSDGWNPIRAYWNDPSAANRAALRAFLKPDTTIWQSTEGVTDKTAVSPDGYSLDNHYLCRPGADDVQLDLFGDYKSNVALYPKFQDYFRTHKPPLLAAWGKNDPFFLPLGAEAFKRDIPNAEIKFFDSGHFALETHSAEIGAAISGFLEKNLN